MNIANLSDLDGKTVLVSSAVDNRIPPTAMRGTIRVHEQAGAPQLVQVELEFPPMFTTRAHHRTITLQEDDVAQLRASDYDGTYSLVLEDRLDPESP